MKKTKLFLLFWIFIPVAIFSQQLLSIAPNSANAGQTLDVMITGTGTHFIQASANNVAFTAVQGSGTIVVNSVQPLSNTYLKVNITVPANTAIGDFTYSAVNQIDQKVNAVSSSKLHVNATSAPTNTAKLVSIAPNSANAGQTLDVMITGTGTHFIQSSANNVAFTAVQGSGTIVVNSVQPLSNTYLKVNITVPANTTTGDFTYSATNTIDQIASAVSTSKFHVNGISAPTSTAQLDSISPNTINAGQTLNVIITGIGTNFAQGASPSLTFTPLQGSGTIIVNSVQALNNTSFIANITIPANTAPGDFSYYATNMSNQKVYSVPSANLHINAASSAKLISITPDVVNTGQTLDLLITGIETHFLADSTPNVEFTCVQGSGYTILNSVQPLSNTSLIANITVNSYDEGAEFTYRVTNSIDQTVYSVSTSKLRVLATSAPTSTAQLDSISPNTINAGQTLNVIITGIGTNFAQGASPSLTFTPLQGSGTIIVNSVQALSNTSFIANITVPSNAASGDFSYYATNMSNQKVYSVPSANLHINAASSLTSTPKLVLITPNVVHEGQTQLITIYSHNTHFNIGNLTIDMGFGSNVGVNSYTAINDTTLQINVTFPTVTESGNRTIKITSILDGMVKKDHAYYINNSVSHDEPHFTISPASANKGQTLDLIITGINTHFEQGSSCVDCGISMYIQGTPNTTIQANHFTRINSSKIVANFTIPNNVAGSKFTVRVKTTGDPTMELVNGFHVNVNNPFYAIVVTTPTTTETGCDGKAEIHVAGGTAPYSYQLSNGSYLASTSNLCPGIYHALVMDADNQQVNIDFLISPPSGVLNSGNLPNSESLDTLYADYVNNCGIDYNELDSAYVRLITALPDNRIEVTWTIVFGSSSINIRDIYEATTFTGIHDIVLRIFCPTRSAGQYITAQDRVDFDKFLSLKKQTLENVNVFPNPFNDNLTITLAATTSAHVTIVDITGKVVFNETFTDESRLNLDLSALEKGNYILKVAENDHVFTAKIVK